MSHPVPRLTVTLYELAKLIGVSERTVWRWLDEGTHPASLTPCERRPGQTVRFPLRGVEEYLGHPVDLEAIDFEKLPPARKPVARER